jgi:hypothetical protein
LQVSDSASFRKHCVDGVCCVLAVDYRSFNTGKLVDLFIMFMLVLAESQSVTKQYAPLEGGKLIMVCEEIYSTCSIKWINDRPTMVGFSLGQ